MEPKSSSRIVRKPLFRQAADVIFEDYVDGKAPGLRLPSEAALVKILGVSMITVRAALRELEMQQQVVRRPGSGTYVAERSPSKQHVAILLDVDISSENLSPFWLKFFQMLQLAFRTADIPHRLYLGNLPLGKSPSENITSQEVLDDIRLERIKGILGIFVSPNPYWGTSFVRSGIPTLDWVYLNEICTETMVRSIFSHFRKQKRRNIAVIGWEGPLDNKHYLSTCIVKLAPEYGIVLDKTFINMNANTWEYGAAWEGFRDIWRANPKKPDGLFVADDMLFGDCQKAICELGVSVPRDLTVAVSTSDARRFPEIHFPFFAWRLITKSFAENYVKAMNALLVGQSLPQPETVRFDEQMFTLESKGYPFHQSQEIAAH